MKYDGRYRIDDIDDDGKVVYFFPFKLKKITGTRLAPILGKGDFQTPFSVALDLAGIYREDIRTKNVEAGNILEPVLRFYIRKNVSSLIPLLGLPDGSGMNIEDPVPGDMCGYDHFHNEKVFGGLVDGYVTVDGKRNAVLEIKTSGDREKWLDENDEYTVVAEQYMLQASLYAELSRSDTIVFAVGFLDEDDYDRPGSWTPNEENTKVIVKKKLDMAPYMKEAADWYNEYMKKGQTPEWTDADEDLVKYLKAYKPGKR
ncbi:MAG: recombinase [Methanomassiliicoccaceae archaeon]|nr:recombinase [Methanomassiliicoccaceae archaeon]